MCYHSLEHFFPLAKLAEIAKNFKINCYLSPFFALGESKLLTFHLFLSHISRISWFKKSKFNDFPVKTMSSPLTLPAVLRAKAMIFSCELLIPQVKITRISPKVPNSPSPRQPLIKYFFDHGGQFGSFILITELADGLSLRRVRMNRIADT